MLNPLFTSVAAVAGVAAIVFEAGAAWPYPEQGPDRVASLLCNLVAVAALTGGAWTFRRPSHDRMLGWLVVLMPVAGYLWSAGLPGMHATPDYLHDHSLSALYTPLAPLAFAALALLTGLRRRSHAPLLACMLCIACVSYELRGLTGWPYQVRLIVWGTALLGATVLLERALRRPRRGITTSRLDADRATADLLQLAGAAALAPPAQASPSASFRGGGGEFGGGGASGRY